MNFRRAIAAICCSLLLLTLGCMPGHGNRIVIGSKNFTEQLVLGELLAQHIEHTTHLPVERRFYLAGTYICQQALLAGRIDMYVEYTGTALTAILKENPSGDDARSVPPRGAGVCAAFQPRRCATTWIQQHVRNRGSRR